MNGWKRVVGWVLFGVALIGLGVYFFAVGLDRADKLASVIGAIAGLAGLGASIYGITRREPARQGGQSITGSFIGGGVVRKTSRTDPGPQVVADSTVLGSVRDLDGNKDPNR